MRYSFVALALVSGCSLFDPLDVHYRPGFADVGADDVGSDSASADAAVDATPDTTVSDSGSDGDITLDAGDDASPDMAMPGCLEDLPRSGLSTGLVCEAIPQPTRTPVCDIVEQTGCPPEQYCSSFFNPTAMELTMACTPGTTATNPTCAFVPAGEVCVRRSVATDPPESTGVCAPGTVCGGLRMGELEGYCREYCVLGSGLGCPAGLYCGEADAKLTEFGFGRCFSDMSNCP